MGSLIFESRRDASGLYYRRNRYYDSEKGRFTQEDPIGLAGGLNVYGFADGDPVAYGDPYGLCPPRDTNDGDCPAIYWAERMQNSRSVIAKAYFGLMGHAAASQDMSDGRTLWTLIGEALSSRPNPNVRLGIIPTGFGSVSMVEAEAATAAVHMTRWGWTGGQKYRSALNAVGGAADNATLGAAELGGVVPTRLEAERMIAESGGRILRVERPHAGLGHKVPHH